MNLPMQDRNLHCWLTKECWEDFRRKWKNILLRWQRSFCRRIIARAILHKEFLHSQNMLPRIQTAAEETVFLLRYFYSHVNGQFLEAIKSNSSSGSLFL